MCYHAEMLFCKQISVLNQRRLVHAVETLNVGTLTLLMTAVCRSRTEDVKETTIDITVWKNVRLAACRPCYKVLTENFLCTRCII